MYATHSFRASRRRRHRGTGAAVTLAVLAVTVAACGSGGSSPSPAASTPAGGVSDGTGARLPAGQPGKGKPAFTMGDKNFTEEYILGSLYQEALQDKGYTVSLDGNIDGSVIIDAAFRSSQIQLYPEYTGEIVSTVEDKPLPGSAAATYAEGKAFEEAERDGTLLAQTPFYDKNVVVVKTSFARKYHLKTIGDLARVGAHGQGVTMGAPPEDRTRFEGLVGMQQVYGLTGLDYKGYEIGAYYTALSQGSVNAVLGGSTDAQLASKSLTVLADPRAVMGFQFVAPVVKKSLLTEEGPGLAQTLDWVDSLLTLQAVRAMDTAVENNHDNPATVAREFLAANGLK